LYAKQLYSLSTQSLTINMTCENKLNTQTIRLQTLLQQVENQKARLMDKQQQEDVVVTHTTTHQDEIQQLQRTVMQYHQTIEVKVEM